MQGTLSLASNGTITGGGTVVIQGSGKILASNSAEATAFNNSRKIARDASENYHVVFETEGEICYEKLNSSTAMTKFQRLSSGNGNNKYPCIAERGGKLYVVWQRYDGSKYDVHFRKSTDGGGSWGSASEIFSNFTPNSPLPVITSPNTSKLTVVRRGSSGMQFKASSNDGSSWTSGGISLTGSTDYSPTLAPTTTYWGSDRTALVYANTTSIIYFTHFECGSRVNVSKLTPVR